MRRQITYLSPLLLLAITACSTAPQQMATPKQEQKGVLKVHPGLLGLPVPPELREAEEKPTKRAEPATERPEESKPVDKNETLPSTLASFYFDLNDAKIKSGHMDLLEEHARTLAKDPKAVLRIEGNADERGPDAYNKTLGLRRAQSVKQALVAKGVRPNQIRLVSYGKSRPKVTGNDEASWAENRRADLIYERK